jgi:hypothetical protein
MGLLNQIAGETGVRINGRAYDYSSIEFSIMGGTHLNVKSIKYKQSLEPGKFRGTGSKIRGRTRGIYEASGGFEMYKEDYVLLKRKLTGLSIADGGGAGYMVASFVCTVQYRELGANIPSKDVLRGCRITSEDHSHSEGNEAIFVSVDLDIMDIISDGMSAVGIHMKAVSLANPLG